MTLSCGSIVPFILRKLNEKPVSGGGAGKGRAWTREEYIKLFHHVQLHGGRRTGTFEGAVDGRTAHSSYMAWKWVPRPAPPRTDERSDTVKPYILKCIRARTVRGAPKPAAVSAPKNKGTRGAKGKARHVSPAEGKEDGDDDDEAEDLDAEGEDEDHEEDGDGDGDGDTEESGHMARANRSGMPAKAPAKRRRAAPAFAAARANEENDKGDNDDNANDDDDDGDDGDDDDMQTEAGLRQPRKAPTKRRRTA